MKDFYRGGNHEKTLNENMDSSLFDETFIVFEIDSIKAVSYTHLDVYKRQTTPCARTKGMGWSSLTASAT